MQQRIPAVFMRGGTSRAIFFHEEDLPTDQETRDRIFLAALGSPDPYGRQLNGLGGGSSSTSKIAIIAKSNLPGVDVDFTFAQVDVTRAFVDYRGTCGNISSAVAPYAIDEGMIHSLVEPETAVTFCNTNTRKRVVARVPVDGRQAAVEGAFALDGVAGTGARIRLDFEDPGGAATGRLLPTGHAREELVIPGLGVFHASLVDATNPVVFVPASELGLSGVENPSAIDANVQLCQALERIRAIATVRMGMAGDEREATMRSPAVPKIALVAPPRDRDDISGNRRSGDDVDVIALVMSMGKAHRAVALTAAMCLAVAAHIPGTIVSSVARPLAPGQDVRIGHPSGVLPIAALVDREATGYRARQTSVYRTARRLMEGWIRVPRQEDLPRLAVFDPLSVALAE